MSTSTFLLSRLVQLEVPEASPLLYSSYARFISLPPSAGYQQCRVAAAEWLITQGKFVREEPQPKHCNESFNWLGMNALIWGY